MDDITLTMPTSTRRDAGRRQPLFAAVAGLSDASLLARVVALAGNERAATVELIAHLAELDVRRL